MDGFLDVWDFFYRQNEVAYSQKISDSPLTSISVHQSMAAIGDADGTVSIMGLCKPLYDQTLQPKEKELMQHIFEREFRREKMLDQQKRQAEKAKAPRKEVVVDHAKKDAENKVKLDNIEESFFKTVGEGDENAINEIMARGGAEMQPHHAADQDASAQDAANNGAAAESSSPQKKPAVEFAPGEYELKGSYTMAGADKPMSLKFKVEEGGIISQQAAGDIKYSLDGLVQANKLIITMIHESKEKTEFEGEFETDKAVKGTYKSEKKGDFDEAGQFMFEKQ
jgi:hypothetical protein